MVFDIRGRRRYAIKVVYAILAVLMGISLFLVVGPINIGELVGNSRSGNAAGQFESEAEKLEAKLRKDPENTNLLVVLMRTRVSAANSLYKLNTEGEQEEVEREITPEALQQLELASEAWSKYLKASDEPAAGPAQFMAPQLITLATYAKSVPESNANVEAATEAQQIVAEQRPNLNTLSTLAFYSAVNGEYAHARKLADQAKKYANNKFERENLDNEVERYEKIGKSYQGYVKNAEKLAAKGRGPAPLESPLGGLGSGGQLGAPGLTE